VFENIGGLISFITVAVAIIVSKNESFFFYQRLAKDLFYENGKYRRVPTGTGNIGKIYEATGFT